MKTPLIFLLHLGLLQRCLGKKCYYPGGVEAPGDLPCDTEAENSPCCAGGKIAGACLANKLCLAKGNPDWYARGSCTDPTFEAPECPKFCLSHEGRGWNLDYCFGQTGSETAFCCEGDPNCCAAGRLEIQPAPTNVWALWNGAVSRYDVVTPLATAKETSSTPTSSASSSGTTSSEETTSASTTGTAAGGDQSDATGSANSNSNANSNESTGLSTGAQAGIGVGVAAGVLLLAAVAFLWWRMNRMQKGMLAAQQLAAQQQADRQQPPAAYPLPETPAYYSRIPAEKHELTSDRPAQELAGQHYYVQVDTRSAAELSSQPAYTPAESPAVGRNYGP
ncbi:hypothetical protein F5144DRAFT_385379 [Chaetomium tenue]|uniref:Uncharacterized protein n=1 Tax=Chaetomium tenue TaxID=1854479 RepID=A0ACB7NVD9_9PEZI|nr:hypothetical protein F5144DRAFT_385379 [Chaetomium globosum]